jgi:hypothetical protein
MSQGTPRPLNREALIILQAVQAHKQFTIADIPVHPDAGNWHARTRQYFRDLPDELMKAAGIHKNEADFECVLDFVITDEMLNAEFEKLGRFSF